MCLLKYIIDFNNLDFNSVKGSAAAKCKTFSILTSLSITTTISYLSPYSINTLYTHPRATKFLTIINRRLDFGFRAENI